MNPILALDQGTTGSTAILFDEHQRVIGRGYKELTQHFPKPGWVEHDPEEIFSTILTVAKEAIESAGLRPSQVSAIGLTNQRETTTLWDRESSRPVANSIVWQCRRTADLCQRLKAKRTEPIVQKLTGLRIDPYFSATKIAWLLDQKRETRKRAHEGRLAFGTIDTWLIWKMTRGFVHATDFTNASRTLLFDIHSKRWSDRLLRLFQIPKPLLPEVRNSVGPFGILHKRFLNAEIPILGVAGDQQAALFGHFATRSGQAKCTFGTGAFALAHTGTRAIRPSHGLLTTLVCDGLGKPNYGIEGSIFMAGAIVQWVRDQMKWITTAKESESIAQSVPSSEGVVLVPAFVGLGAPHWDPDARAAILGITRGTTSAHIVRAALESIAYQTFDLVSAMEKITGKKLAELRVDGGVTQNEFVMGFLADLLQKSVVRPTMVELTAFGAARLAAVAKGLWLSPTSNEDRHVFNPRISSHRKKALTLSWNSALARVRTTNPH